MKRTKIEEFSNSQQKIPKIEGDRQEKQKQTYFPNFQKNQPRTGKALFTKNMKTSS